METKGSEIPRAYVYAGGYSNIRRYVDYSKSELSDEILCFDNFVTDIEDERIRFIREDELKNNKNDYEVVIVPCSIKATYELKRQMESIGIEVRLLDKDSGYQHILHIFGWVPNVQYERMGIYKTSVIHQQMENMYRAMFDAYANDFMEKYIDLYFYIEDMPQDAYRIAEIYKLKYIFCCCTTFPVMEKVIPIPNYFSCFNESTHPFQEIPSRLYEASLRKWVDTRAVWKGDLSNAPDDLREMLFWMGERFPSKLNIESYSGFWKQLDDDSFNENFTPMTALADYKYLIDIRGWSFYARRANLLQLGRVVLVVDSIYRDWYEDDLHPYEHYVPVKADLSDLIEKIDWLDANPEIYETIVNNAREFCARHFSTERYLEYLRNVTMKVVRSSEVENGNGYF